jgi:predicted nuclease of restriction endonuclease-like RecB superfamily
MLSKAHRVYRWIRPGRAISSDRLEEGCLPALERALAVYRSRLGQPLGQVRNAARLALEAVRPDRVEALVELLDQAATYEWPRGRLQAERRVRCFEAAAREHPLLDPERARALAGTVLGAAPGTLEEAVARLYADYPEFHRLAAFPGDYTAQSLRADYDLAQAQALLYSAVRVEVEARADFKHILQYARLSRLLYRLAPLPGGGYRFVFDGPTSLLRRTHAYGVDFARFLAALVQARDWRMRADIALRKDWRPVTFALSEADGLSSRVPAPRLFDSRLEETFARKFGAEREGWRLRREAVVLEAGGTHVVPDFLFTHADGTEVALEIAGYWTPEYLADKLARLARVRAPNLIVAVPKGRGLGEGGLPAGALVFSHGIRLGDLLARLEAFRRRRPARRGRAGAR